MKNLFFAVALDLSQRSARIAACAESPFVYFTSTALNLEKIIQLLFGQQPLVVSFQHPLHGLSMFLGIVASKCSSTIPRNNPASSIPLVSSTARAYSTMPRPGGGIACARCIRGGANGVRALSQGEPGAHQAGYEQQAEACLPAIKRNPGGGDNRRNPIQ